VAEAEAQHRLYTLLGERTRYLQSSIIAAADCPSLPYMMSNLECSPVYFAAYKMGRCIRL
jgi:hypothetical protein